MKTFINVLGLFLILGGILLAIGAAGSLDQDACTITQYILMTSLGLAAIPIGGVMAVVGEEEDHNG